MKGRKYYSSDCIPHKSSTAERRRQAKQKQGGREQHELAMASQQSLWTGSQIPTRAPESTKITLQSPTSKLCYPRKNTKNSKNHHPTYLSHDGVNDHHSSKLAPSLRASLQARVHRHLLLRQVLQPLLEVIFVPPREQGTQKPHETPDHSSLRRSIHSSSRRRRGLRSVLPAFLHPTQKPKTSPKWPPKQTLLRDRKP